MKDPRALDDFVIAAANAVIEQQEKQIAELKAVLKEFMADNGRAFLERDECYFCDAITFAQEHASECPVTRARSLLGK